MPPRDRGGLSFLPDPGLGGLRMRNTLMQFVHLGLLRPRIILTSDLNHQEILAL